MGIKLDRKPDVVLTFIGDGATSEGDCHEALNFAAVYHVPCVFVIQNNQWAISVPYASQTRAPRLAYRGAGYGMPAVVVDGNDVVASYEVTAAAVRRARAGGGPTLIEALTYRLESHTTADDATRYRSEDEVAAWRTERDPLVRLERLLRRRGAWRDQWHDELQAGIRAEVQRVRAELYDAPAPAPEELFDHVYVEPGPSLLRQREAFRREMAQREPCDAGMPEHDRHRDEQRALDPDRAAPLASAVPAL
jgi:pyruvate dehydrogenase E1 component alpha subunit